MKKGLRTLLGLGLAMFSLLFAVHSADAGPVANTTPPPYERPITLFSSFGSGYLYLFTGGSNVANIGNDKISISGYSTATQRVDSVGVQVTLQQWTGTAWIDVYKSPSTASSSSANAYREHEVSVSKGFYYRSKSYHWTQHGSVKEEGTLYSSSILVPNS